MNAQSKLMRSACGRRDFLRAIGTALCAAPAALALVESVHAAELPLLNETDPAAKALKYVADVKKSTADPTHACTACALYEGVAGAVQGPCKLFPKNQVKAAGTCSAWAPQM